MTLCQGPANGFARAIPASRSPPCADLVAANAPASSHTLARAMAADQAERRPLLTFAARRRRQQKTSRARTRNAGIIAALVFGAAIVHLIGSATRRDLVDELATAVETLTSCGACKSLLAPLKAIAHFGDATFLSTLITLCVGLGIQDPVVCRGALGAQAPIIAHSLRGMSIGGPTGTLFCAKTFGLCEYPETRDWDVVSQFQPPAEPKVSTARKSGAPPLQVVHLSDLHIDREYSVSPSLCGVLRSCSLPHCRSDAMPSVPGTSAVAQISPAIRQASSSHQRDRTATITAILRSRCISACYARSHGQSR